MKAKFMERKEKREKKREIVLFLFRCNNFLWGRREGEEAGGGSKYRNIENGKEEQNIFFSIGKRYKKGLHRRCHLNVHRRGGSGYDNDEMRNFYFFEEENGRLTEVCLGG